MTITNLLLDIEGTTCPVSFVNEILFPYARKSLSNFLLEHNEDQAIGEIIKTAEREWNADSTPESIKLRQATKIKNLHSLDAIRLYLEHLIDIDRKSTALKDLQGKIWRDGYQRGEITSQLFKETAESLKRWHNRKLSLSVYSSGSVQAQKLLYRHTKEGNLEGLFDHWFDTHIGNKKDTDSYRSIAKEINTMSSNILFISDNPEECDAAQASGMLTLFSLRDGNPNQDSRNHTVIKSLNDVDQYI